MVRFKKKKFFAATCLFGGPLVPVFWISGDISSGFQSQSGFCLKACLHRAFAFASPIDINDG